MKKISPSLLLFIVAVIPTHLQPEDIATSAILLLGLLCATHPYDWGIQK